MKHLSYSIIILLIFISVWGVYVYFSHVSVSQLKNELREEVLVATQNEDWNEAKEEFKGFKEDWSKYRRIAHLFFNTEKIYQIDLTIASCEASINAEHIEEAINDLAYLLQYLSILHESEDFSLANLF